MANKIYKATNKNSKSGVVINRRIGEAITIGDNIRVTFIMRRSNEIKLLIEAPIEIPIRRELRSETVIKTSNFIQGRQDEC